VEAGAARERRRALGNADLGDGLDEGACSRAGLDGGARRAALPRDPVEAGPRRCTAGGAELVRHPARPARAARLVGAAHRDRVEAVSGDVPLALAETGPQRREARGAALLDLGCTALEAVAETA